MLAKTTIHGPEQSCVWLHRRHVGLPRRFGTQPWPLVLAHVWCCFSTGVADHSMDLYLDNMLGGNFSWARYLRMLDQTNAPLKRETRTVTSRVARLLQRSGMGTSASQRMNDLANTALSDYRVSHRAVSTISSSVRDTKRVTFANLGGAASAASLASGASTL